jgi:hypothetical protein
MKTTILTIIVFFGILLNSKAQVILEATYDTASANLYMVNLEISGQKFVKVKRNQNDRFIYLYNLNHSIWKTIDCNAFPVCYTPFGDPVYNFEVLYVSENLFNLDNKVEFMFVCASGSDGYTAIYNEDGTNIFMQDSALPKCRINIPQTFQPIYNTTNGTKMILSFTHTNQAKVYALQGVLTSTALIDNSVINESLQIFPNPSGGSTTIEYKLPVTTNYGYIEIYDLNGKLFKTYHIDNTFNNIVIDNNELASGTYIYCLKACEKIIDSRQINIEK